MGIGAATEGCVPAVPDSPWVLQGTRMLKDSGWICTVGEELGSIFLAGNRHTDGVLCHRNRGITYKTIKAQTGNMEDIARSKDNRRAIHCWRIVFGNLILVIKLAVFIPVHRHAVWHQGIEGNNLALAVTDNLRVGIPP